MVLRKGGWPGGSVNDGKWEGVKIGREDNRGEREGQRESERKKREKDRAIENEGRMKEMEIEKEKKRER